MLFFSDIHGSASGKAPSNIPLQDQHLALAILLELAVQRGTLRYSAWCYIWPLSKINLAKITLPYQVSFWTLPFWTFWDFWWDCRVLIKSPFCTCLYCSQLLSAVLLLLRLWDSGTREMDNERSTQGTSAPLLPLLQRFQNIHTSKEEPVPEEEIEVKLNPWIIFIIALFFQVLYLATYALRSFLPLWAQMRVFCATLHCLKIMTWPLICGRQL